MKRTGLLILILSAAAFPLMAQDAETATEAAGALTKENATLLELIITGGWAMIPLGVLSFMMVVFVVKNFISLRSKTLLHTEMMPELLEMMLQRKVPDALVYCRTHPSMFTNSFGAGLERVIDGVTDFDKIGQSVKAASVEQVSNLMKPIDYLSIIGATSPMVGLLGTVSGMIKAFQTMGSQGMGKPELLAANIGEALITTATGLIIAIPAMFTYFYFKKGFGKTLATLSRNISYLLDALESGKRPASTLDLNELEEMSGREFVMGLDISAVK
ncbi:MotA/TolQ/ExbB proton channel family protein [Pontiella sp.]|uniref:MotA/TolQ/ExbB proton channel family protein n=1 Tax=Pontiella sp. TaxID=2837462 RepID=UPI00356AB830